MYDQERDDGLTPLPPRAAPFTEGDYIDGRCMLAAYLEALEADWDESAAWAYALAIGKVLNAAREAGWDS